MQTTVQQFHHLLDLTHTLLDQFLTDFTRLEKQVEHHDDLLQGVLRALHGEHAAGAAVRRVASPHKPQLLQHIAETSPRPMLDTLAAWVGRETCSLLYDTESDGWDTRAFCSAIVGKRDVVLAVVTEAHDVFGAYISKAVRPNWTLDKHFFIFSLRAPGRLPKPKRWFPKKTTRNPHHALYLASKLFFQVGPYNDGYFSVAGPRSRFNTNNRLSTRFDGVRDSDLTGLENDSTPFGVLRCIALAFETV